MNRAVHEWRAGAWGSRRSGNQCREGASVIPAIAEDGTDGAPPMSGGRPGSFLLMFSSLCEVGGWVLPERKGRRGKGPGLEASDCPACMGCSQLRIVVLVQKEMHR